MRTILLAAGGSLGDIRPFLSIGKAIIARGHRVVVLTTPAMRAEVEREGLECRWAGREETIEEILRQHPEYMSLRGGPLVLKEKFIPACKISFEAALQAMEEIQIDCVVSHPVCLGVVWAAWRRGCRTSIVHLAPTALFQAEDAAVASHLPSWMIQPLMSMGMWSANRWVKPMAESLGVAWDRTLFLRTMHGGDALLGLWSPSFRANTKNDPPHLRVCGFPRPASVEPLPDELSAWLDKNERPIVFGLGSTAVHVAGRILDNAVEVCRKLNRPGVILGGPARGTRYDEKIAVLPYASFDALFPRAAVVVHHGGIGTTLAAMRSGTPSLALPFGHDQFDNGARLKNLGVGDRLWQGRATVNAMVRKLQRLLPSRVQIAAKTYADTLQQEADGAAVAADVILNLL